MACKANSWRPAESISMAITAFSGEVGTSQRESRVIVVKAVFGIAGRVAQSLAVGKPFARWWVHNGLLTVNGEKMSKSLWDGTPSM